MLYLHYDYTILEITNEEVFNKYKEKYKFSPAVVYEIIKNKNQHALVGISKNSYILGYLWLNINHPICRYTFMENIAYVRELNLTYKKKDDISIDIYKAITHDIEQWLTKAFQLSGVAVGINKLDIKERNKYAKLGMKPVLDEYIYVKPIDNKYNIHGYDTLNINYINSKLLDIDRPMDNVVRYIFSTQNVDICNLYKFLYQNNYKHIYLYFPYEANSDIWKASLKHVNIIYGRLFNNQDLEIIPNIKENDFHVVKIYPFYKSALQKYSKYIYSVNKEEYHDTYTLSIDDIINDICDPTSEYYIFTYRKKIIGYISTYISNNTLYINKFIISKEYRNRHFGKEVLSTLLPLFRNCEHYDEIKLDITTDKPNVIQLFKDSGFTITGYCTYEFKFNNGLNEEYIKSVITNIKPILDLISDISHTSITLHKTLTIDECRNLIYFLHINEFRKCINITNKDIQIHMPVYENIPKYDELQSYLNPTSINMSMQLK